MSYVSPSFDPSPYTRVTFWNSALGASVAMLGAYATNQATVQRYLSLPTLKDAKRCVCVMLKLIFLSFKIFAEIVLQSRLASLANVHVNSHPCHHCWNGCD